MGSGGLWASECVKDNLNKLISRLIWSYYRGPNHPMKLRIYYGIRRMMHFSPLIIPYVDSGWITVDEQDLIQREILAKGSYEPEVWQSLASFVRKEEVIWDVGAHIGSFSIRAALQPNVKEVHTFEPDPLQLKILKINLALNRGQYFVHSFALSDKEESRTLHHGPLTNTGLSSLVFETNQVSFEVQCKTSDQLVFGEGLRAPTLMKIDVEGWEFQVLKGAKRLFREWPPRAIVLETGCQNSRNNANSELVHYLIDFGYQIYPLKRPSGQEEARENFLAVLKGND